MFDGYLVLGGTEVLNQARVYAYVEESDCPPGWLRCQPCPGLEDALGVPTYQGTLSSAPWYDADDPATHRFLGIYPIEVSGFDSSTRVGTVTEGILDGGVVQGIRRAVREIRVRGVMIGLGHDGLDAGLSWLDAVLDGATCSSHQGSCGEVDGCFFITCPPERGLNDEEEYDDILDPLRRRIHGLTAISGPLVTQHFHNENFHAYLVEFTLIAATPYIYGMPRNLALTPTPPTVVQDSPYNLIPYPSAELASETPITVATNYSTNPSVETNSTDWVSSSTTISGTAPTAFVTQGRSTDIAAGGGAASYRVRLLGDNGTTSVNAARAYIRGYQQVAIPAGTGRCVSINIWTALTANAGSSPGTILNSLLVQYGFYTSGNVLIGGSMTTLATVAPSDFAGKAHSMKSITVPATAASVRVQVQGDVTWSSTATSGQNSDIRLYADALAVTIP